MSSSDPLWEALQARLADLGGRGAGDLTEGTIVVLPSLSFPPEELRKILGAARYEERLLCLVLMLRAPELEMVYVTSTPIDPAVVDYYLSFLPTSARTRLHLVALDDPEPSGLSEKLLKRPEAVDAIRAAVTDPQRAYIVPFNVTEAERDVALALDIPILGPSPELVWLGGKSGSRAIARAAGVAVLPGAEDLYSTDAVEDAIAKLQLDKPEATAVVVKLNEGFSGQGNAIIRLSGPVHPLHAAPTVFCASEESWESFGPKIAAQGAIVEQELRTEKMHSPSVQLRIAPDASVEIVSTHDQILGGPDDQVYLGCRFPADPAYREPIVAAARRIADELARRGVIGTFGADFIVVADNGGWDVFLSEINLRLGGTTHPFLMAKLALDATYDQESGELLAGGRPVHYVSTDNLKSDAYKKLAPRAIIDALAERGLSYDPDARAGTFVHLLGATQPYGKLGLLCVAASQEAADDLYADSVAALDEAAQSAYASGEA
ncbi:MAG: peptide ligase PGM1-related protein [Actinomycetota bacterium]|nr:peptide ligase PGM1-related protein [Actinomycetota bacterium]